MHSNSCVECTSTLNLLRALVFCLLLSTRVVLLADLAIAGRSQNHINLPRWIRQELRKLLLAASRN